MKMALFIAAAVMATAPMVGAGGEKSVSDGLAFAAKLGVGINIGNTYEAPHDEYFWGNRPVTKELLQLYKTKGFKTLRVPVTWANHFDAEAKGHPINKDYMAKIDKVIRMCLDEGFYVMVNLHNDGAAEMEGGWLYLSGENDRKMLETLRDIWTQIAENFKDCNEHLIFEGWNELKKLKEWEGPNGDLAGKDDWNGGLGYAEKMNRIAHVFVRSVRRTGGNNAKRWLVVPTYAGCPSKDAAEAWKAPMDDKRVMAEVHVYSPGIFALWGDKKEFEPWMEEEIARDWAGVRDNFISKGIPVIVGEMGAKVQYFDDANTKPNIAERVKWAKATGEAARKSGAVPVLWETGGDGKWAYPFVDRKNCKWYCEEMLDAFLGAFKSARK